MPGWVTTVLEESLDELLATAARRAALLASWTEPLAPAGRHAPFAIDLDALASSELLLAGIVACVVMRSPAAALAVPLEPCAVVHASRRPSRRG